jgi:hypothetical protein
MKDGAGHDRQPGPDGDPWGDLTDDVVRLTEKLKSAYRRLADEEGPSEAEIRQALATLAGAWSQIARSVGAALEDDEVRTSFRQAASSLATAVGYSFSELVDHDPEPGAP